MTEVASIKFNNNNKYYYFDPNGVSLKKGDKLVVETAKGQDLGECVAANHYVDDDELVLPLRPVIRVATEEDLELLALNKAREKEAFEICKKKIAEHNLEMRLVDVECSFDGGKIIFFFTSENRVDFRELVKDLAAVFRTRIEMRQIGVRDETKMLGGIGICGRPFCCNQFLRDFEPVSTKMAKTQSMSLNPAKISGSCGRLMCCLRYEQAAYEYLLKQLPKTGAFVQTVSGYGNVVQNSTLRQQVRVRLDGEADNLKTFDVDQVATVPGGRPANGEKPADVLVYVQKKAEEEAPEEDLWMAPRLFADEERDKKEPRSTTAEEKKAKPVNRKRRKSGAQKKNQQESPEIKKTQATQPVKKQSPQPQANPVQKNTNNRRRRKPRPKKPQGSGPQE